jgi:hypothetical protein
MAIKEIVETNIQEALNAVQKAIDSAKRAETIAYRDKDEVLEGKMKAVINRLHTAWLDICEVNFTK